MVVVYQKVFKDENNKSLVMTSHQVPPLSLTHYYYMII